jgi:hypothetical protein
MTPTPQHPRAGRWPVTAVATLVAIAAVIPVGPVSASETPDMVLDWNLNAVNALVSPPTATPPGAGQPPPVAAIHLAMVHGAVYDAVNLIDGGYKPYLDGLPSVSASASKAAAAATAAHDVLVGLQPALPLNVRDSLDELYAASLTQVVEGQAKVDGIDVGSAVAQAMLADRADDGRYVPFSYTAGSLPGQWRPELPAFGSDPFAWVGNVRPFTLTSTGQFRTAGPFDLASAEYAADYNEVKAMGPATGSSRSEAQTLLAQFYSANPMVMINRAFRELAARRGMTITEAARLFGMSSMASADAGIGCTDDKHHWSFWRPITAIREAAVDGNPDTAPQADWTPFFATPPYPDHPSGYNCFAAAMLHTAALVFGHGPIAFELLSPVTATTRSYDRFTAVLKDTINARIWQGLHFRNPDVQGAWLGKKVAQWVAKHYFQAID